MIAAIQRRGRDSQDSDMNLPISRTVAITDWYHLCDIITTRAVNEPNQSFTKVMLGTLSSRHFQQGGGPSRCLFRAL